MKKVRKILKNVNVLYKMTRANGKSNESKELKCKIIEKIIKFDKELEGVYERIDHKF